MRKNKLSATSSKKELLKEESEKLLTILKSRFEKNMNRHNGLEWKKIQEKLEANPPTGEEKLWSLSEMERTGAARTGFENANITS